MCGIASATGVTMPAFDVTGGLGPNPDAAGVIPVYGPPETGPRVTYVNPTMPGSWPAWITASANGSPVDTGTRPGGTWSGGQQLPDITVMGRRAAPWVALVALLVVVVVVART